MGTYYFQFIILGSSYIKYKGGNFCVFVHELLENAPKTGKKGIFCVYKNRVLTLIDLENKNFQFIILGAFRTKNVTPDVKSLFNFVHTKIILPQKVPIFVHTKIDFSIFVHTIIRDF